jgi:arsenite transporter
MTKQALETYQVLIYIGAIITGLFWGVSFPESSSSLEVLLWPVLGLLLYATFTQISLIRLKSAFREPRFIITAIIGNFILIPVLVWHIIQLVPDIPAIQLGVALVLLVPCTDWFITFTHLGGGDTEQAILFSPISLFLQIISLPFYLFLFFGNEMAMVLATNDMLFAFLGMIILPLLIAGLTEKWAGSSRRIKKMISGIAWLPVPLLAIVIFLIAASQSHVLSGASTVLVWPGIAFLIFLMSAALLSKILSQIVGLPVRQGRVLAFSLGSRNSFVVLPLALALPGSFEIAVFVVVLQSMIELFGMAAYVWLVPGFLFRE